MAREFDASDILEVAERMERNAVKFYRKAAGVCDDPVLSRLFTDLAQWERQHVRVFADMRNRLAEPNGDNGRYVLDPDDQSPAQLPVPPVFGDSECPAKELVDGPTKAEVLKAAIQKEEDTIAYYTGLKESVLGPHNIQVIEAIIHEEKRHIRILLQSLEHISMR